MRSGWSWIALFCVACGSDSGGGGGPGPDGGSGGAATGGTGASSGAGGAGTGGSGATASGGATSGGSAGVAAGGSGGAAGGAGGAGATSGSGGATGGSGGTGGSTLDNTQRCTAYCAQAATLGCPNPPPGCMDVCMTQAAGPCASSWQPALDCLVKNNGALCAPASACATELSAAANCDGGALQLCANYCKVARSSPGCTSETCYLDCGTHTQQSNPCKGQWGSLYSCAMNGGTPNCTDIQPTSGACTSAQNLLAQCTGTGGTGGTGGTSGTGGTGGTGVGGGGTGGTCAAPKDPTLTGCSQPDGNLKVTGATAMVAVTYGVASAPATCTAGNSQLYTVSASGTVNLGVPSPGCLMHRVCNYDPTCTTKYSPGKLLSRCFNGTSISCVVQ